ncbi:hypothetical protein [Dyadobacter sp. CY347]|uniref:hypothetical protein n=1 Tax=Dyadobacter sp. CY347 TaxID=2909336 RepID=UPI001F2C41ED|nr:hypothetical protein [Dyadobacter sp. CY347]MCF2487455.1 hypothetical protein [Dyadobacter sp. CY347]
MNALNLLVGLAPVDSGPNRMYVNRMPNVNAELIESIAESEERSADDPTGLATIWKEVKDEAYDCLKSDLLSEMAKRANFREVVESSELPDLINDPESIFFMEERIIGVMITMPKSRYQLLFIRNLYINYMIGSFPVNAVVKAFDIDKGVQIGADIAVEVGPDMDCLPVNMSIDCSKTGNKSIFVGVVVDENIELLSFHWSNHCSYAGAYLYNLTSPDAPILSNLNDMDDCYVALEYEIRLSIDQVIAQFADRLRRTYAIMCAIGIIDRGLKSKRASRWTMVNRDAEKQNLEDLKADLKKEMAGACRQIYGQVEQEKLALISRPDDQQGYFVGDYV